MSRGSMGCIPTAENLALVFWDRLQPEFPEGLLRSVRVWETEKNWAEVGDHGLRTRPGWAGNCDAGTPPRTSACSPATS